MASDLLPGFRLTLNEDEMDERQYLRILTYTSQNYLIPAMDNIIRVSEDGTFIMYNHSNIIHKSKLQSIHNHTDQFTSMSQVTNALALLKNLQVSKYRPNRENRKSATWPELEDAALGTSAVIYLSWRCNLACASSRRITGVPLTPSSSVPSSTCSSPKT